MTWRKLDDELAGENMPYSAMLADGLTANVNWYPNLNSGSSICWLATDPVTWASYGQPMGTVVTLDVGFGCAEIIFRFVYQTATDHGDGDGLSGRIFVRHLTSNREVSVGVSPSTSATTVSVALRFDAVSNFPVGPQAFFIGFQSSVLEVVDTTGCLAGMGNQVLFNGLSIPEFAGEKYWLLEFNADGAKNWVEEDALGSYRYQIGYMENDWDYTPNTFIIWPNLDTSPAVLHSSPDPLNYSLVEATIYELGAFGLISISYEVISAPARNLRQLAHAPAVSLNSLSLDQSLAVLEIRPDVAANACESRLGYRLSAEDDEISGVFALQGEATGRLSVSFRAVRLSQEGEAADWSLKVFKADGSLITPEVVIDRALIPRFSIQYELAASPVTMRVIQGARRDARSWGMRDSMPLTDTLKGAPLLIETASFTVPAVSTLGTVITFRLSVTAGEFYIYGLNARFI